VPGKSLANYEAGHLLAASLGGSNSDLGNFAAMSGPTNRSRGGIVLFEAALRTALAQDAYPPWIVVYTVRCEYVGSTSALTSEVGGLIGGRPNPQTGRILFDLAKRNATFDTATLAAALPNADRAVIAANIEPIKRRVLMNFAARRFAVDVRIEQAPENARLPASSPFDNHM
jgi:hypothetical protein